MTRIAVQLTAIAAAALLVQSAVGQLVHFIEDPSAGPFVDIESIGQPLNLPDDGEVGIIKQFPGNSIFLPGLVVVGQNGGMGFGQQTETDLAPDNQEIPSGEAFIGGQAALAFWDDIDDKEGGVFFVELVDDPQLGTRLIVQWNYHNFDGAGSTLRFQVHILQNTAPTGTYSQYFYDIEGPATGAGASATIGYQDGSTGYGDLQYSFNLFDAVTNGTVLSLIVPESADLNADGLVGIVDFLMLLGAWGPCADCQNCPADLNGDCDVGLPDLLVLLSLWS